VADENIFSMAEVGIGLFPFLEARELRKGQRSMIDDKSFLPQHLRGLSNPTVEESIEIVRRLALRGARVIHVGFNGESDDLGWFGCPEEDYEFDMSLHVSTICLASIGLKVESTGPDGEINVRLNPWMDVLRDWLLEEYVPSYHYLVSANLDDDDSFEYDLYDKLSHADLIDPPYNYFFFEDHYEFVDVDSLMSQSFHGYPDEAPVVARRKGGLSDKEALRSFEGPFDELVRCLVTAIKFFHLSGSEDPFVLHSVDELRRVMVEYIEEFPKEIENAQENFEEDARGELGDYKFWFVPAFLEAIGLTSIRDDGDDRVVAALKPPDNWQAVFEKRDDYAAERDFFKDFEIVGPISLGAFELLYFTDDEDEDD